MPCIDELLDHALFARVPGAAVGIVHSGHLTLRCQGLADVEWDQPVTFDTVFQLGSVSKPLTALLVTLLARDGVVDLDAPLRGYLPEYPKPADTVRIRHLLTHTSGIPNFLTLPGFRDGPARLDHTAEALIARFRDLPLNFEPGSRYSYSNSGYRLLEQVVARATGATFPDLLFSRVFAPAGLTRTAVLSDADLVPERARGYVTGPDGLRNAPYFSLSIAGGAGGIGSTLTDLLALDQALHSGVFGLDPLTEMAEPVRLTSGRREGYGFGLATGCYRGRRVLRHAGGTEGFSCLYAYLPTPALTVVVLTNLGGYDCAGLVRSIVDMYVPAPPSILEPTGSTVEGRSGVYSDGIFTIEVTERGGSLIVDADERTYRMRPITAQLYVDADDPDMSLRFHDDEPVPACTLEMPLFWITGYKD